MTPDEIATQSDALLNQVLEEAYAQSEDGNLQQAFVYRHARTILHLSNDVFELEANRASYSAGIIVRSMLESLFNLVAAVKVPKFAEEKVVWEIEDEIKRIQKWMAMDPELTGTAAGLRAFGDALRKQYQISVIPNWNTFECARAAELDADYRREYFFLSKRTHATSSGMISMESQIGRGHVLRTVMYILLTATGHLVQVLPTKAPQAHVDHVTRLVESLRRLVEEGAYDELDADESS